MILKHINNCIFVFATLFLLLVAACSDHEDVFKPQDKDAILKLSEQKIQVLHDGRSFLITAESDSLSQIRVSSNNEWIKLDADTLSASGTFIFYVEPNEEDKSRDAQIRFLLNGELLPTQVEVHQTSEAEDGDNAVSDSITRQTRVGYGYDMRIDYMDPKSVTEPIFDYGKLLAAEQSWGTIIAQEGRSFENFKFHCAYSIEEMASWLTQQTTTETDLFFYNKKVQKFKEVNEYALDQQSYGYSSLEKVVASRYLDEGKIESLIRQGYIIFTDKFSEFYQKINTLPEISMVDKMIETYGTHYVLYADLGGRLEYTVNFKAKETSKESVERYLQYKNGRQASNSSSESASHSICSNGGFHFDIYGGTEQAVKELVANADTKDRYGQVNPSMLGAWLNSIKESDMSSVTMMQCHLKPIWQLFTNPTARSMIISCILEKAHQAGGDLTDRLQKLGLDNFYKLKINSDMLTFSNTAEASLVKVGYLKGIPKVEISNEYVPAIRGDHRVSIIYPIYREQTNIRRGIFVGDAENPPSEVMFSDLGDCYVRPLPGFKAGDRISTLYYIDGAFYTTDMGIQMGDAALTMENHYVHFYDDVAYPVVKIGPEYWLRKNITTTLYFGDPVDPTDPECEDYNIREDNIDDMLYANVFCGNSLEYRNAYPGAFDAEEDASKEHRIHWYVPRNRDIEVLQKYIGKNCKALFPNQQTGFEAQFAGYLGNHDVFTGKKITNELHGVGKYCMIASKEMEKKSGQVLILSPNYTLQRKDINNDYDNYYPVRPCRSSYYKYEIKKSRL